MTLKNSGSNQDLYYYAYANFGLSLIKELLSFSFSSLSDLSHTLEYHFQRNLRQSDLHQYRIVSWIVDDSIYLQGEECQQSGNGRDSFDFPMSVLDKSKLSLKQEFEII
jgi:hypothetical protein